MVSGCAEACYNRSSWGISNNRGITYHVTVLTDTHRPQGEIRPDHDRSVVRPTGIHAAACHGRAGVKPLSIQSVKEAEIFIIYSKKEMHFCSTCKITHMNRLHASHSKSYNSISWELIGYEWIRSSIKFWIVLKWAPTDPPAKACVLTSLTLWCLSKDYLVLYCKRWMRQKKKKEKKTKALVS